MLVTSTVSRWIVGAIRLLITEPYLKFPGASNTAGVFSQARGKIHVARLPLPDLYVLLFQETWLL